MPQLASFSVAAFAFFFLVPNLKFWTNTMKKLSLKVFLHDDKEKRNALKSVTKLTGIDSISVDMKNNQLTVIGTVDPFNVVTKLRRYWTAEIVSVAAVVKEVAKGEPKEEVSKGKAAEAKKKKDEEVASEMTARYLAYHHNQMMRHYYHPSAEEDPNACAIM